MVSDLEPVADQPLDHNHEPPRRLTILGATGSIGTSTLAVIADNPEAFEVEAVTAFGNARNLARIARSVNARSAVVANPNSYQELKQELDGTGIEAASGPVAIEEVASRPVDIVVAGIVGAAGLAPTMLALEAGSNVALANKECLVCAGDLFVQAASDAGTHILPLDSEHNAVFQALTGNRLADVATMTLTASGGPFRDWTKAAMAGARPEQALKHPNWSMGPKITIDSATLMNKGLELIEAHHLFGVGNDMLEVVVHPQSVIHGMVTFHDGTTLATMGAPDMRLPIAYCLHWPRRPGNMGLSLNLAALGRLTFEKPDTARFPALRLAREALDAGGWATNILNAANEIAVAAFLSGSIGFLDIARLVEQTLDHAPKAGLDHAPQSLGEALALDKEARGLSEALVARMRGRSGSVAVSG